MKQFVITINTALSSDAYPIMAMSEDAAIESFLKLNPKLTWEDLFSSPDCLTNIKEIKSKETKMFRANLFRITQAAEFAAKYAVDGLKQQWKSPDYQFGYEFDPKTGDYYIYIECNSEVAPEMLNRIANYLVDAK